MFFSTGAVFLMCGCDPSASRAVLDGLGTGGRTGELPFLRLGRPISNASLSPRSKEGGEWFSRELPSLLLCHWVQRMLKEEAPLVHACLR